MGEVHNLHHAPDHGQADTDQGINPALEYPDYEKLDYVKKHINEPTKDI